MADTNTHSNNSQFPAASPESALRRLDAGYARLAAVASPASSESNQPINILRLPEVIKRIGLCRASIYLHIARGTFPKQISLGARAVGWLEHEISAWLAEKISARSSNGADMPS